MGTRRRAGRATRLGRFVRGRRPDRNPLRRGSDWVETAVLALLVIVFLVAAPFAALASGSWALARAHQAQLTERASGYRVPAVVLKLDAPSGAAYADPGAQARWTARDGTVINETTIGQLKRFKEDAREVAEGFECGILLDGFNDVKEGDVLEVYETREVERTDLATSAAAE